MHVTLAAGALELGLEEDELSLALTDLELSRGSGVERRLERHRDGPEIYYVTKYRREDLEAAAALIAAKRLGFDG